MAAIDHVNAELEALRRENAQLRTALASRIVIEQAKGMLVERLEVRPEEAFRIIRDGARRRRMPIHNAAREVLLSRVTEENLEQEAGHLRERPRRDVAPGSRASTSRAVAHRGGATAS